MIVEEDKLENGDFRKSSFCTWKECLAVAIGRNQVTVKDTKTGSTLLFTKDEWRSFIAGVKANEFNV